MPLPRSWAWPPPGSSGSGTDAGLTLGPHEWRTGKTADLLRLLALDQGHPVRHDRLVDRLWPHASPERARGSLRTARSQIRRAIGVPCVVRQPGGLVLQGAWVDVVQFERDADEAMATSRVSAYERAVSFARTAERHYRGRLHAADDQSAWVIAERERLTARRHETLCDAAVSALALGRPRDALDFATVAARLDGSSESAHRALMRAHARLGEIGIALRVFESYRVHLADELGADPSEQTRALHLRLLRGRAG